MPTVGLNLGQEADDALAQVLAQKGFTRDDDVPEVRVVSAAAIDSEQVAALVSFVVSGGTVVVAGGTGPLMPALHLSIEDAPVKGAMAGAHPLAADVADAIEALPVSGVGYALYRVDGRCVVLAGPRGDGWVGCVGRPDPALVLACLACLAELRKLPNDDGARS